MKCNVLFGNAVTYFVAAFVFLFQSAYAQSAQSGPPMPIREIEITSERTNLGGALHFRGHPAVPNLHEPVKTILSIRENGDAYYRGDELVDTSLVTALARALTAPANLAPDRDDLGFTPEWLKANAANLGQRFSTSMFVGGQPVHEDAFVSAFVDTAVIDKAVPVLFLRHYCADCDRYIQSVHFSVVYVDGTRLEARSSSDSPFMLPWHRTANGTEEIDYNANISRAIAALLPQDAANHSLLVGEHIAAQLGQIVLRPSEQDARLVELETKTGGTLAAIRTKYTIQSAMIGDYGDPAARGKAEQPDLLLRLTATDRPANFADEVALTYVDGKVVGTERFLAEAPYFETLVLSVPWLSNYVRSHPKTPIDLAFVHDASFSDAGLEIFRADMQAIGRDNVIPRVEAQKGKIGFLTIGSGIARSEWLVLPDRHMLLWIVGPTSELPAWSSSDYSAKPCAPAGKRQAQCIGREISESGKLLPE